MKKKIVIIIVSLLFIPVIIIMLGILHTQVLDSVRAYVHGESLYSKGQKDAVLYLLKYTQTHNKEHYYQFQEALKIPLGDKMAREALQLNPPDYKNG